MRYLLFLIAMTPLVTASDVWIFLNDGCVGLGDPTRDPITLKLPDNSMRTIAKEMILFQRAQKQVDEGVASLIQQIVSGQIIDEHAKKFRVLGAAAVPKLLFFYLNRNFNAV